MNHQVGMLPRTLGADGQAQLLRSEKAPTKRETFVSFGRVFHGLKGTQNIWLVSDYPSQQSISAVVG